MSLSLSKKSYGDGWDVSEERTRDLLTAMSSGDERKNAFREYHLYRGDGACPEYTADHDEAIRDAVLDELEERINVVRRHR